MEACRVHIALHGCLQDAGDIGGKYIRQAGYNEWADTNHIVVLYPQTRKIGPAGQDPLAWNPLLVNPNACWDWWGYHDFTNAYMTHTGQQMATIRAMLTAVTAAFRPAPAAPATDTGAPDGLIISDVSDDAVALAWRPVSGATAYKVYRGTGSQGPFTLAGSVAGPSFGDSGLTPDRDYYWQVSAVIGATESARPTTVAAHTAVTPPPCATPGTCAVAAH
jgi:poly(3-hydroxybutyrate) depolymerase